MEPNKIRISLAFLFAAAAAAWMAWWFVTPVLWAGFIAIGLWPIYVKLRNRALVASPLFAQHLPLFVGAGLLLTIAIMLGLVAQAGVEEARNLAAPEAWGILRARVEASGIKAWIQALPLVGTYITKHLAQLDPASWAEAPNLMGLLFEGGHWGKELFSWIGASVCCALALSGLLAHGTLAADTLRGMAERLLDTKFSEHLTQQAALTRSIFNSIVVLGAIEALLFWCAYSLAGLRQPALLALITGATSMIPLAATVLSGLACLYLALTGSLLPALSLGIFSALVLLIIDPVVRPLLAGKNTEMPFWLTTLAMLAGLQTLGLLGIFLGPQLFLLLRHLAERASSISESKSPPN